MAGDSVSEAIICEKDKQLFEELGAKASSTSTGPVKELLAPRYGLPDLGKTLITQCCEACWCCYWR